MTKLKTKEMKEMLKKTFGDKRNWNRKVEIENRTFCYDSGRNEIRVLHDQPSGTVAVLVACFAHGHFMWCC